MPVSVQFIQSRQRVYNNTRTGSRCTDTSMIEASGGKERDGMQAGRWGESEQGGRVSSKGSSSVEVTHSRSYLFVLADLSTITQKVEIHLE